MSQSFEFDEMVRRWRSKLGDHPRWIPTDMDIDLANGDASVTINTGQTVIVESFTIEDDKMNILDKAKATVDSSRQNEYGDPVENWVATALIATITQRKPITPEDVVQVMCAAKGVRAGRNHKEDTNIDSAGYAEIRERVQKAFRNGTVQKIVEKLLGGWVQFGPKPLPIEAVGIVNHVDVQVGRHSTYVTFHVQGYAVFDHSAEYAIIKKPQ